MNITVNINAPELTQAISALANSLNQNLNNSAISNQELKPETPVQPAPTVQAPTTQAPTAQAPTGVPTQQPIQNQVPPIQPAPPQQSVVPTTETNYTMDQLAVAATQLMDTGKREDLLQILAAFGVQALTALPKEQYGAFATKLREKGAKI